APRAAGATVVAGEAEVAVAVAKALSAGAGAEAPERAARRAALRERLYGEG
ncbi:MAG: hypothetical protein IRZ16_23670, partial [Myxococcaceae bacterium]|nr:hypothetical protein [Myxococcaceae bacterium]